MRLFTRLVVVLGCLLVVGAAYAQETSIESFSAFGDAFSSRLSPDGALLATFESGVIQADTVIPELLPIRIYDVASGEEVAALADEPDYAVDVAFSPDSAQLAALYPTGWLHVWTVADGETVARLPIAPNAGRLTWLPDSQTVAVAAGQLPQIQLWDTETGAMTAFLTERFTTLSEQREAYSGGPLDGMTAFAAAPDGDLFAVATFFDRIQLWTTSGDITSLYDQGTERPLLSIMALTFTPDGSRLVALNATEQKLLVFDIASGQLESEIETDVVRSRAVALSPDGTRAAWLVVPEAEDAHLVVAELETGETTDVPLPPDASDGWVMPLSGLFFSHDGQRLILSGRFARASSSLEPGQNPVYRIPLPQ